jgi:hypothetical protein
LTNSTLAVVVTLLTGSTESSFSATVGQGGGGAAAAGVVTTVNNVARGDASGATAVLSGGGENNVEGNATEPAAAEEPTYQRRIMGLDEAPAPRLSDPPQAAPTTRVPPLPAERETTALDEFFLRRASPEAGLHSGETAVWAGDLATGSRQGIAAPTARATEANAVDDLSAAPAEGGAAASSAEPARSGQEWSLPLPSHAAPTAVGENSRGQPKGDSGYGAAVLAALALLLPEIVGPADSASEDALSSRRRPAGEGFSRTGAAGRCGF